MGVNKHCNTIQSLTTQQSKGMDSWYMEQFDGSNEKNKKASHTILHSLIPFFITLLQ